MFVWMLPRLLVLVLVEVRKPSLSFLLANAVNHANPVVVTLPVVHNKRSVTHSSAKSERAGWTYSQRIDVNKMRNLHALFQTVDPHLRVVLKNSNSL